MRINKSIYLQKKRKKEEPSMTVYVFTDNHNVDGVSGDPYASNAATHSGTRLHFQQNQKLELFVQDVLNDKPDLVLGLGDFFDRPAPIDHFKANWNMIPEPKAIMLGNHDYTLMGASEYAVELNYNDLSVKLGFENEPVVAGSKLNKSFYVEKDGIAVKFIMCDFSLRKKEDGTIVHHGDSLGSIIPEQLDWIKDELNNSTTNRVVLASHHGMHYGYYFPTEYADALKATLAEAKSVNPSLNIFGVFGHQHRFHPVRIENMLPEMLCYNASAVVERFLNIEESKHTTYYTIIKIYEDRYEVDKKPLTYTGEQPDTWSIFNT